MGMWATALAVMQRCKGICVLTLERANIRTQRFKEVLHTIFHLILVRPLEGSWGMSKRTLVSHCRAWPHCHIMLQYPHCLASPHSDHRCYRYYRCPTMDGNAGTHKGCPDDHCLAMGGDVCHASHGLTTIIISPTTVLAPRLALRVSRLHAANTHDLCVFAPLRLCLKNGSRPQRREARTQQAHRCWRLLLHLQCPEVRIEYTARCEPGQQQAIVANIITRRGDQAKA